MLARKFRAELAEKRNRHAEEVQRFILKTKEELDPLLTAADLNLELFYSNLEVLAKKWLGYDAPIGDCDGKRLVNGVFARERDNPIFHAIMVDRIDYFISSFQNLSRPPIFWLELACLCGAQKIAIYLLGNITADIWTRSNIIPYALSSGHHEFALEIAKVMKSCAVTDPGLINSYNFGNFAITEQIRQLFLEPSCTVHPVK